MDSELERASEVGAGLLLRDDAAVVVFVADEPGRMVVGGRANGFNGNRLGEPLRVASVAVGLTGFSAGGGIVGLRKERVLCREDMAAGLY